MKRKVSVVMGKGTSAVRTWSGMTLHVLLAVVGCCVLTADGASVVLKMRAINPSPTEKKTVEVRGTLPKGGGSNDVVGAEGFDVAYDVGSKLYYVHRKVELAPGEVRTFEVELRDVWTIPPERLQELADHAKILSASLAGSDQAPVGERLRGVIDETLRTVRQRQDTYVIGLVPASDHIYAYELNSQAVEQTKKDVGMLENLVIAAGKDPQKILGLAQAAPPPTVGSAGPTGETIMVRMRVTNPLAIKKKRNFRRDLPEEVRPADIVDAAGLKTGFDSLRNVSYVYADDMEFDPQESKEFSVRIRNPWAATRTNAMLLLKRLEALEAEAAKQEGVHPSVKTNIASVLSDLLSIQKRELPAEVNEQYVATARRQAEDIRTMEGRVMRIEELFRQSPPNIFNAPILVNPPPSRQTTWMIIYIILAFLGVVSLLFFLRWYGRSKAEQLGRGSAAGSGEPDRSASNGTGNAPPGASAS